MPLILNRLNKEDQAQIINAVAHYNVFDLPEKIEPETRKLTDLVRDADKIDIYRVMISLYRKNVRGKTSFITHHLPDDSRISPERVKDIQKRQMIDIKNVRSLNDMKLMQISWVFDLNFPASIEMASKKFSDYILNREKVFPDFSRS